jgi:hypothetical protein
VRWSEPAVGGAVGAMPMCLERRIWRICTSEISVSKELPSRRVEVCGQHGGNTTPSSVASTPPAPFTHGASGIHQVVLQPFHRQQLRPVPESALARTKLYAPGSLHHLSPCRRRAH